MRIDIAVASYSALGTSYRVRHDGRTLLDASRNPEFVSCQALLAKGITGRLRCGYRDGRPGSALRQELRGRRIRPQALRLHELGCCAYAGGPLS